MIIPEEIQKNVLTMKDKNGSLNIKSYKRLVTEDTSKYLEENNITITELFNLLKYNYDDFPKCPTYGSPVRKFYKNHTYCSNKCAQLSPEIQNKIKKVHLERYGVENASSSDVVKDKIKKTNLEKYRVEYTFQSKGVKDKIKKTNLEKYGKEILYKYS